MGVECMQKYKGMERSLVALLFVYTMLYFTFQYDKVFWYLYAFTILVTMAIVIVSGKVQDELPTWRYLLFGIGYGTVTYGIIRIGYWLIRHIDYSLVKSVKKFLVVYGPMNIWHFMLLIIVIAIGEELFWRGYIQQQLKQWFQTKVAVVVASLLFALSIMLGGFWLGAIAAFIVSMIFGSLYEWKKSMPLIIVAHIVFVLLLFLILPIT